MNAKDLVQEFSDDEQVKHQYRSLFQDCYELTIPGRRSFNLEEEGQRRTLQIYDSTAVQGIQDFASQLQAGLTPNFTRWANLEAGTDVPDEQREEINRQLEQVRDLLFDVLETSNFSAASHEVYLDLGVGTGALLIEEGTQSEPIRFVSVPLTDFVLGTGAYDTVSRVSRERRLEARNIQAAYPKAEIPEELQKIISGSPKKKVNLIEMVRRDETQKYDEKHDYWLLWKDKPAVLETYSWTGEGSCPWIVPRWSQAAGERYGRGPAINALGDIKTANLTVQLVLQNAELAIAGLWKLEDDGVINPDTIQILPGSIVPYQTGTKGLENLVTNGNFNVADIILADVRENIRRAFYGQPLGSPDKTPMKAAEVQARMGDLARRIGSSYGRLQYEFVQKVVARCLYILKKKGMVKLPKVNGREVRVVATSPLARQQNFQDVEAITQTALLISQTLGPQMANIIIDGVEAGTEIATKLGAPKKVIRSDADRKKIAEAIAQMAQTAMAQGETPP